MSDLHLLLPAEGAEASLLEEARASWAGARATRGLVEARFPLAPGVRLPHLVFARQLLPDARSVGAASISAWAGLVFALVAEGLPGESPWRLQVEPEYGRPAVHRMGARAWHSQTRGGGSDRRGAAAARSGPAPAAGRHRCRLIQEGLLARLRQKRRHLLRRLGTGTAPFTPEESLAQLLLTSPTTGYFSLARAPLPFEQRHLLSPFLGGQAPVASDPEAPSRAFAKLAEAESRLGRAIQSGESCADLGAAPGSWTRLAARRGARVMAVDRAELREDLMSHPNIRFTCGDAFKFQPPAPVDWLLCDVIAAPERTADLLIEWLRRGWCRYFVVTLKLGDAPEMQVLNRLKLELAGLAEEFFLLRLSANKKEACAFGRRAAGFR